MHSCTVSFIHSHKKRKDSMETRVVLLVFLLELEISGLAIQSIHQNSEKKVTCEECFEKMALRLF